MSRQRLVAPVELATVHRWFAESDVLIAGYGVAGASTALAAATAGAQVQVLERTSGWGGAAALSGGFIYLGGGTPLQAELGFDDSVEEMIAFLMAAMGPGADEQKVRLYCEGSIEHYHWLVDNGVHFKPEFFGKAGHEPFNHEGLMYSGGENAWPFNTIAKPAPRGHVASEPPEPLAGIAPSGPGDERDGGFWMMAALVTRCAEVGVAVTYDVRSDQLIVDTAGKVHGIRALVDGQIRDYRARKGVVLAAGCFTYNDDMMTRYAPNLLGRPGATVEAHDGHSILMAQAMGADLGRMDGCEVWSTAMMPELMCQGVLVDQFGQRFVTEDTYPGRVSQFICFRADDCAYLIVDDEINERTELGPITTHFVQPKAVAVAETIAELEKEIGLPEGALEATITLYNRHAANGHDPVFHKRPESIKPLVPPFGAFELKGKSAAFTLGGLRTSVDGEVLHVAGHPIPNLYAVGRSASGIPVWGYASGTSLGDGSFFGRRAGRHAATAQNDK